MFAQIDDALKEIFTLHRTLYGLITLGTMVAIGVTVGAITELIVRVAGLRVDKR
ncbi:MAG: hypothetical protein ACM3ZC_03905 [Bacteroidota bacterium]